MNMEGRGFSELYRNTSEELFIRTMMENSIGMPAPTIDMLGFRNLSQSFRTDSEELFKSWLTSGENNGNSPTVAANRTRQASRRISTEIAGLPNQQQHAGTQKRKGDDTLLPRTNSSANEPSSSVNQESLRNTAGKEMQDANFYLAKAWFHSSQPMTRSRSSELRRRYAAMQNSQTSLGVEQLQNVSGSGTDTFKQKFVSTNGFSDMSTYEIPSQLSSFVSLSNSSSSTFETQHVDGVDKISSVVSMLKGTLERKKLSSHTTIEALEDSSAGIYGAHNVLCNSNLNHMLGSHIYEKHETLQDAFVQVNETGVFQTVGVSLDAKLEDIMAPTNLIRVGAPSQELSQSESSVVPPAISTGFDICDGSSNTYQAQNGRSTENGSSTRDIRECTYENSNDNEKVVPIVKKGGLVRYGSVKSSQSVENGDPTKKRRVERSRKMAEAKERNLTPAIPSDMQSVLKRCENLEKEVRSLKLNLAFMNRKDSEQIKQIEELQKQNEDLAKEKERLLEEIERIISETSKI